MSAADIRNHDRVPNPDVGTSAQSHYTGPAGQIYHHEKRDVPSQAIPWIAKLRTVKIQPSVKPLDTVFEYGVGSGWNLLSLRCKRKLGFDLSEHVTEQVQAAGIEFVADPKGLPSGFADVILCHHTLEHLPHPVPALHDMRRMLRPGGTLLLYVPFEKESRYRSFNPSEPNHHLFSWNVQTLANLVIECGFTIREAKIGKFGYDRFAAKHAVRFRLGEPGFRMIRNTVQLFFPMREVRVVAGV